MSCHADDPSKATAYASLRERHTSVPAIAPPHAPKRPTGGRGGHSPGNALLAILVVALAMASAAFVFWNETRRRTRVATLPAVFTARQWSPYVSGALLGIVVAVSMALFGHRLSGGGAYQQLAAPIGRVISRDSVYFHRVLTGAARWELTALFGALLGAFASSRLAGTFRVRTMPDAGWTETFGSSVKKRWLIGFLGAALTEIASGIAGGCTASLAVSGGAALAPGAFAFMAAMFAGGIPTAWWFHRRGGS